MNNAGNSLGNRNVWMSNSSGFSVNANLNSQDGYYVGWRPYIADFNGDGKSDILWDESDTNGNSSGYRILWTNSGLGTGFTATTNLLGQDGFYLAWKPYIGDINTDGKSDILWIESNASGTSGQRKSWISNGSSSFTPSTF